VIEWQYRLEAKVNWLAMCHPHFSAPKIPNCRYYPPAPLKTRPPRWFPTTGLRTTLSCLQYSTGPSTRAATSFGLT
jgi:hypothetical protein